MPGVVETTGPVSIELTSAGPATGQMEPQTRLESQLGAAEVTLTSDVLDRIDEIVPPGVNISEGDAGYVPDALQDASLRRRRA